MAEVFARLAERLRSSAAGHWYAAKEPRDRGIIKALAAATAAVVLWAGVWQPVADWRTVQANRHGNAQLLLRWMRENESRVRSAIQPTADEPSRSILPIVTRTAQAHGLTVGRLQPEADGVVSVTLQGQPFGDVIAWLAGLEETNGIAVIRASVNAEQAPGMVNAQLRLR